ncbi:N-acetylglucosamine-6-phosphate deacetylase [Thermanaerothrix sp.]|jgi:N-acetylglucosamine-6-phosphate deacetylase|uniref:N-acetylglucosamine-6-phosphate deacetylase n=1 Tax=Thermanaerothrix sp. TaxID=2972675 RepID=UPI002ADE45E3|nr:N-acetylglucosamine-6-phosphate deacetylase [Thermanaerothrix sp.]
MRTWIQGGIILTPERELTHHAVVVEEGKIVAIEPEGVQPGPGDAVIDAHGLWVVPGMIDIHIHGIGGVDTMDATEEALQKMAHFLVRHGVTAFLPTTVSASRSSTWMAIRAVESYSPTTKGAQCLGIHLEGPYLNPNYSGAQPAEHLRPIDPQEYQEWLKSEVVRLVTLAPELEGAPEFIAAGRARGVYFAAGHSGADYDRMMLAASYGLSQATHLFNGMPSYHHRQPGIIGAVLDCEAIIPQLIVDGIHLHPATVRLVVKAKGPDRVILISDAMRATGLPDGQYSLGDQLVEVKNGIARTLKGGLAGSTLTLDAALRNALQFTGLSLRDVLPMVTSVPAKAIGLNHKGGIKPGADADIVLLDGNLEVSLTMVRGVVAYRRYSENSQP